MQFLMTNKIAAALVLSYILINRIIPLSKNLVITGPSYNYIDRLSPILSLYLILTLTQLFDRVIISIELCMTKVIFNFRSLFW